MRYYNAYNYQNEDKYDNWERIKYMAMSSGAIEVPSRVVPPAEPEPTPEPDVIEDDTPKTRSESMQLEAAALRGDR